MRRVPDEHRLAADGQEGLRGGRGHLKKAIELNPSSAEAYNGLANLYNAQKKFDQAAEASAQAAKLGAAAPGGASASTVFNQGVIAWNASRIDDAKKAFEEAVKLIRSSPRRTTGSGWRT